VNDDIYPTITDETQLAKFVGVAHQHKVKTLLSIGGWFGSISMSKMASTPENRTAFVKKAVDIVLKFGLDGMFYK
jgi:chitinase